MTVERHLRVVVTVLRGLLGSVFMFQFFDNLDHDNYTSAGYRRLIESYVERGNAPGPWKDVMGFVAEQASFFAPLQAVGEAALAIGLLTGVAVPLLSLAAGGMLSLLFLSEIGIYWLWELPPLVLAAALLALLTWPRTRGFRDLLLDRSATGARLPAEALLALLVGAVVGALALANRASDGVALRTGVAVGLLLAVGVVLRHRLTPSEADQSR